MNCEDLLEQLNAYVDGNLDPAVCRHFESHLAGCNPCHVVIDNIRKTITLYKDAQPFEIPLQFRERLHAELRRRWKRKPRA